MQYPNPTNQIFPVVLVKSRLGRRSKRDVGTRIADIFLQAKSYSIYYNLQKIKIDYQIYSKHFVDCISHGILDQTEAN